MVGSLNVQQVTRQDYLKIAMLVGMIFAVGFLGFQYYSNQRTERIEKASGLYETMSLSIQHKEFVKAKKEALTLLQDYKKTPYGPLAALALAYVAIEEQELEKGEDYLKEALMLSVSEKGPVRHAARTRLAKVLAAQQKYEDALSTLEAEKAKEGYITLYEETKGDIYLQQNKPAEAKEAFKKAKDAAPQGLPIARLELKLADLSN